MKISIKKYLPFTALIVLVMVSACKKEDFDTPPSGGKDPNIVVNMTIAQLKDMYRDTVLNFDAVVKITQDFNIAGTVIADDKSGNFYKTIVIDDGTAGISIRIDRSEFFREYPIGRRIFIKLKNLVIGHYGNLIQLGGYIDLTDPTQPEAAAIPFTLIDSYVFPGVSSLPVIPQIVTIADLQNNLEEYQNRLVRIEDVQFRSSDTSKTYADAVNQLSGEVFVEVCDADPDPIMVRSSGYASFASAKIPNNNGSITAVFTEYNGTPQLILRDTYDVTMNGLRCGGTPPPPPGGGISENFSSQTSNTDIALPGWYNINAVGTRYWRAGVFSGDTYAQATAFGSGLAAMESWLITPGFDLATIDTLSFISSWAFFMHNGLSVYISTDFTGSNFGTATWTLIPCTLAQQADGQYVWVPSGDVPLTAFSGANAHIGFKYVGDATTNTTTWRVDNVMIH